MQFDIMILTVSAVLILALLLVARSFKGVVDTKGRKIFLLVAMVMLPGLWLLAVTNHDIHEMDKVDFCIQCHSMDGYYESLHSDDEDSLVADHYLNNRIPQDRACYQCHADHTPVTGLIATKMNGLREAYIEYLCDVEMPIKARKAFKNDNCLICHENAKNFRETHEDDLKALLAGETTCLECHDVAHVLPAKKEEKQ